MIVYIKTISVNYYITLRQLIRLLKLKRSIKPYLLICLFRKEVLQQSLPSTRRNKRWTTSRVFWRHRDLYNGITTNRAGYPSGHRYTPHTLQFSSYNKNKWTGYILEFCSPKDNNTEITLHLSIQAELLVLHDHCDLHGHRRYERSNTFSRGLIYIGGNSPLYLLLKEWGKSGEKMLLHYFRVSDFVYELTRLVPFWMPTGPGVPSRDFLEIVKQSILFSKRLGWLLY